MRASGLAVCRLLLLSVAVCAPAGLPLSAQGPSAKDKEPAKSPAFKLPSGAIIVVTSNPDAIDKPEAIYLSPEKFKELNDQIEQLKKQVSAEKPAPAGSCVLDGRVEQRSSQSIVRLKATFGFITDVPRSVIFLGCKKAHLAEATLEDGKLPPLAPTDKGLSIQVDSPGRHTLQLILELPLLPRDSKGTEVGFEVGLPGAAITTLNFKAPPKVKRLTVTRRRIDGQSSPGAGAEPAAEIQRFDAEQLMPGREGQALGAITYLAVSWEGPGQPGVVDNTRSVDADVQVNVGESDIQTEARLRLKGTAKDWKFLAPFNAEVTVGRAPASGNKPIAVPVDQAPDVVRPAEPGKSEWLITFREPNSTELLVLISSRSPRNRNADAKGRVLWPVGPLTALDALQQSGTIRVKSLLPTLRAIGILKGDTQRVDGIDDPMAEAVYRYRSLPPGPNNHPGVPLELDIRPTTGVIQTRVQHFLSLGEGGWRLCSEIQVTPIRNEIDSLEIEVPSSGVFDVFPPRIVDGTLTRDSGPRRRIIQVKLVGPQKSEFKLTLEGSYPIPAGVQEASLVLPRGPQEEHRANRGAPAGAQEASLVLPRLLNVFDRSDQVTVTVPEGTDLTGSAYQLDNDKPGTHPYILEPPTAPEKQPTLSASVSRAMSHVELAWKPHRADVRVEALIDVRLGDRQGQVTQQLHYTFAEQSQKKLRLKTSMSAASSTVPIGLSLTQKLGSIENLAAGEWSVTLPNDPGKEITVPLSFSFQIPQQAGDEPCRLCVPLIWPEGTTATESRVRILRDRAASNHRLPSIESDVWQELPVEVVPGETPGDSPALPLLVLRASGSSVPLTLTLRDADSAQPSLPGVWIDRTLIQAQSSDQGQQYRSRFHLSKWVTRGFELELPAGAAEVEVRANGVRVDVRDALSSGASVAVLRIPLEAWREPQIVEVDYRLPAVRSDGLDGWITRWQPPRPHGRVAIGAVRWQVAIAQRAAPLSLGDADFQERWALRNGYAHPVAAWSTLELEKWLIQNQSPEGSRASTGWEMPDAGVTALQVGALAPLRIVVVPRTLFLFAISLAVLVAGLLMSRLPRRSLGLLLVAILAAALIADTVWPQPAGHVLAAAQPGLLIFLLVLGIQQFLQWRYRRRLARMPGFSRIHVGSSLIRTNGKTSKRESPRAESPAES